MKGADMNAYEQDNNVGGQQQYSQQAQGAPVPPAAGWDRPHRSPALAAWLSLMPGLGHVYLGYYQRGLTVAAVWVGCIAMVNSELFDGIEPVFGIGIAFTVFFAMIDAHRRAHHINRVGAGLGVEQLPEDFKMGTSGGSLFGGITLVVLGLLILLDLRGVLSLEWIKDWWPLFLVVLGGRLVWQARRKG